MSVWGQIWEGSKDTAGRVLHAFEKRANSQHNTSEWGSQRDDWTDGWPDAGHPSMLDAMDAEVRALLAEHDAKVRAATLKSAVKHIETYLRGHPTAKTTFPDGLPIPVPDRAYDALLELRALAFTPSETKEPK